jgi:16S rRNA (guanine527-N7)-methyltransferase
LDVALDEKREHRLIDYLRLLQKWNRVYNLTAIREPRRMVTHHLLDSLAVLPFVTGPRLLDVGSGAGLPGMVLAIADPSLHCTLIDSSAKKARFLTQAVIELKLGNVEVVQGRVQDFHPAETFNTIVSRAFSDLAAFVNVAAPLLVPGGCLLTMKGARAEEEAGTVPSGWRVAVQTLAVPQIDSTRALLIVQRESGD